MNHAEDGRYEGVAYASGSEAVLWVRGEVRNLLGIGTAADGSRIEDLKGRHRGKARELAAAETADRETTTFAFYADEVLRANLWPSHWNEPEEAADQLEKVRAALAGALSQTDPFRAAVEFEKALGTSCDVRLVRLFEDTLPWVEEAAVSARLLDRAAETVEEQLLAASPMAKGLKRMLGADAPEKPAGPRP